MNALKGTKLPKKRKKANNSLTSIMTAERVNKTAGMLLSLKPRLEIVEFLTTNYHIQPKSCDAIITNAYQLIRAEYNRNPDDVVSKHLAFYYKIAEDWKSVDPKAAMKALENIEKLLKMHVEAPLIQNNSLSLNFENVNTEDIMNAINNLKQGKISG